LLALVCIAESAKMLPILNQRRASASTFSKLASKPSPLLRATRATRRRRSRPRRALSLDQVRHSLLEDTLVQLTCNVVSTYITGDHTIFLGEVESLDVFPGDPLIFLGGKYYDFNQPADSAR